MELNSQERGIALKHGTTRHPNPFDTCPDEILGEIFCSADNGPEVFETRCSIERPYPSTPFYLSSVCRRWRLIATSTPALWAYIYIDNHHWLHRGSEQKEHAEAPLKGRHELHDFVETCFARSGKHPLYIQWRDSLAASLPDPLLVSMLAKESHRWREIVFHSRGNVSTLEAILKHQDFKGLHVLRKIYIAEDMSPNPNLLGNSRAIGAPNLTSVVLCSSAENTNAITGHISLAHITYLHLTINYDQRLPPVASIIASSSALNYLHLSLNIAWHHIDSLQPGCTMDLPHLSRLSVSANPRCLWHFLSRMRVPALTHLHVSEKAPSGRGAGSPNITDVDEFLDVVPPALEALTVQCMDFPQLKRLITATEPRKVNLTDIVIGSENDEDEWNIHTFLEDVVSCAGYTSRMQEVALFNQVQDFEGADDGFIEAILGSLHRAAEGSPLFEDPRSLRIDIYSDLPIPEEAMDVFDPDTLPQCIDICLYEDWTSPVDKWRGYFLDPDPEEDLSGFFSI